MARDLATATSTGWTTVAIAALAVAAAGAFVATAWIRVVDKANKLQRSMSSGDKRAASVDYGSWQLTALGLFIVTVVLAGITVLSSTQIRSSTNLTSTDIFIDASGIGALLSGIAACLVFLAGYRSRQKQQENQQAAATKAAAEKTVATQEFLNHILQHIDRPLETEDIKAIAGLAQALNGDRGDTEKEQLQIEAPVQESQPDHG